MLSVSDVLENELFSGARVVAGHSGLNRSVTWLHNAGVPDAPVWLNGGELVMTTMINLPEDADTQIQYLHDMAEKQVAGLVITIGRYIEAIPDYLIQAADELGFPLAEIPYTARFVDIAKAINEQIAQENMHTVRRALSINQDLTRLVLEGHGFRQLAKKLAELVGHSISIENDRFEAIAYENIAEVDEARRYTQIHGRTDPRLVQALEQRGYLPRIRETLRAVHLPPLPDVGLEMERILAPVVVHGEVYGFMWVIADDHSISELDMMAIEIGATIAALMTLYQESVQSAEASLKGTLLSQLIQGEVSPRDTILTDQSLRYGVDLRQPYAMLLVDHAETGMQKMLRMYRVVNQLIATDGWAAVVGQFAGQLVVLAQDNEHLKAFAARVQEKIAISATSRTEPEPRVGVSGVQNSAECVKRAYEQCRDVLHITRRLNPTRRIVYFDDLGYLHALYQAGPASISGNPMVPVLRRLLDEKQADLFHTLEAYLDEGGNGVSTADTLHIHRSTLNYRLARIVQICGFDLQDPLTRMNLQVALKLMRLFEVM